MPLTTCPDCNRQVSDQAPTCPACGRVFKKQKQPPPSGEGCFLKTLNIGCLIVFIIIGLIIFIIVKSCYDVSLEMGQPEKPDQIEKQLPPPIKDEEIASYPDDGNLYIRIISNISAGRDKPDKSGAIVVVLGNGAVLQLLERQPNWFKVRTRYADCWMPSKDLEKLN